MKSLAAEAAGETLIVTDHSKFGKTALSKVFDLSKVDYIITDKGADEEMMEAVRQKTQLILV